MVFDDCMVTRSHDVTKHVVTLHCIYIVLARTRWVVNSSTGDDWYMSDHHSLGDDFRALLGFRGCS